MNKDLLLRIAWTFSHRTRFDLGSSSRKQWIIASMLVSQDGVTLRLSISRANPQQITASRTASVFNNRKTLCAVGSTAQSCVPY